MLAMPFSFSRQLAFTSLPFASSSSCQRLGSKEEMFHVAAASRAQVKRVQLLSPFVCIVGKHQVVKVSLGAQAQQYCRAHVRRES